MGKGMCMISNYNEVPHTDTLQVMTDMKLSKNQMMFFLFLVVYGITRVLIIALFHCRSLSVHVQYLFMGVQYDLTLAIYKQKYRRSAVFITHRDKCFAL